MAALPKSAGSAAKLAAKVVDDIETLATAVAREAPKGQADTVLNALKQCTGVIKQVGDAFQGPAQEPPAEETPAEDAAGPPAEEAPEKGARTPYEGASRGLSQDVQSKAQAQPA